MTEASQGGESPVLTLDPFEQKTPENTPDIPALPKAADAPVFDENTLTQQERQAVEDFSKKIDLSDSNVILQYGAGTQKKMAEFSESTLENVRTKDLGEVGNMLGNVVAELKGFNADEDTSGFWGFFKKKASKIAVLKEKYEKADGSISKICQMLEGHQVQLMKDIAILDKMYDLNKGYFKELSMYILAGKRRLDEVRQTDLPALVDKAKASGLPEDTQNARDLDSFCNRFEKKIHDLELTRMVSIQTAPQIRMVQANNTMMLEKLQSTLVNTIPLWKSQMVLALGVEHSNQAAKAQREVSDMTNELLRSNAEKLKLATVETAKESERGVVDIETLKVTNESLISTLDEVMRIQAEGRQKRQAAEAEMSRIENQLKQKLLEIQK